LAGAMPVRELAAGSRAAGLVARCAALHARGRPAGGARAAPAEHQPGQARLRPPLRERRRLLAQPVRRVVLREPLPERRAHLVELAIPDPAQHVGIAQTIELIGRNDQRLAPPVLALGVRDDECAVLALTPPQVHSTRAARLDGVGAGPAARPRQDELHAPLILSADAPAYEPHLLDARVRRDRPVQREPHGHPGGLVVAARVATDAEREHVPGPCGTASRPGRRLAVRPDASAVDASEQLIPRGAALDLHDDAAALARLAP